MWRVILGRDIEENLSGSKGVTVDKKFLSVKGWWKMVISHLKHSYLNWRANPCRRKRLQFFIFFHNFLNLVFLIFVWTQSNYSSAWHDNQFFFHSHNMSTPNDDAYHKWPSKLKNHFSCGNCFGEGRLLVQGLFTSFLSKERVWLKSVLFVSTRNRVMVQKIADTIFVSKKELWLEGFSRNGPFSINVPQSINQGDFKVSRFWDLYFWPLKGFGRFKAVASLDAYQITNYQFPSKTHHFFVAWFLKNSRRSF